MAERSSPVVVRPLTSPDVEAAASLVATCSGLDAERHAEVFNRVLERGEELGIVLVAVERDRIVATGRVAYFEAPPDAPANAAPNGWYLMGVNVHPEQRRKGVGSEITRARLEWIFERASRAWFFTGKTNGASIALHRLFHFELVTDDFWFPTTGYDRGGGLLFCRERQAS